MISVLGARAAHRRLAVSRAARAWSLTARERFAHATEMPRSRLRPVTEVVTSGAWAVAAVALLSLVAGTALGWTELVAVGFTAVLLLAVAVPFVLGGRRLTSSLELGRDRVVVGERANGRLHLRNDAATRLLPSTVEMGVGRNRVSFDLPSLGAEGEHEELFAIPTARRAVLDVGPVTAVRSDPFGLLRREVVLSEAEVLHVHPRTVRIDGSAAGLLRDLEGETIRKITDTDVAFHALRTYVPGDDRRHVHWKSTARTGTLMVRQFEETRRSHLLVVLSTRLDDYADDEEFELAVSIAGSLGVQTLREGQQLDVATSREMLRSVHATPLLDALCAVAYEQGAPGLTESVRRLTRTDTGASIVALIHGSLVSPAEIRKARRLLPPDVRVLALQASSRADTSLRRMGDLHLLEVHKLDDLAPTVRRASAL